MIKYKEIIKNKNLFECLEEEEENKNV